MSTSIAPVFDTAQLQRRTMGDSALQVELLSLFVTEAERLMRQVEEAPNAQVRAYRLNAMTSLARNTGAVRLAQAARQLETDMAAEEPDLAPLRAALLETLAYVHQAGL
jgi:HPt (histidine-containing phosphotransfer) domain-containing protein